MRNIARSFGRQHRFESRCRLSSIKYTSFTSRARRSARTTLFSSKTNSCFCLSLYSFLPSFHFRSFYVTNPSPAEPKIIPFKLVDVGEGIVEVEIVKWHVKEGDFIKEFDPICDAQTDKATIPISSRYDGIVAKRCYKEGEIAKVGTTLIEIDVSGVSQTTKGGAPGQVVSSSQPQLKTQLHQIVPPSSGQHVDYEHNVIQTKKGAHKVLAAPAVRHLAKKHNIDISQIVGTGKDGRVRKEDVLNILRLRESQAAVPPTPLHYPTAQPVHTYTEIPLSATPQQTTTTTVPPPTPVLKAPLREDKVIPLRGYARIMAQTMTASAKIPHFGYCDEIKMDNLMDLRQRLKPKAEQRGVKLTYLPFIIKATSLALREFPIINSSINEALTEVTVKGAHNIGIATDTPHGLVVPNIKNVQDLSIFEIAMELNRLIKAANEQKLTKADITGGTITLSNIGIIGGTYTKPVLLSPEVCIGAFGRIQKLPRFDEKGNVVPVHIMQVSWSCDHRVLDGVTIARFTELWKEYLEHPATMLFDLK
jgi:2-oxoisovalerate dehydrogenase E2 component (dihydrolipoyl transacylase)